MVGLVGRVGGGGAGLGFMGLCAEAKRMSFLVRSCGVGWGGRRFGGEPYREGARHIETAPSTPLAGCGAVVRSTPSISSLRPTCQCRHMTAGQCANAPAGEEYWVSPAGICRCCGCQGTGGPIGRG